MSTGVILLAAGEGRRFGSRRPKQFLRLNGRPLFAHSLGVFRRHASVQEIVLVVNPNRVASFRKKFANLKKPLVTVASGGSFRGVSVRNGMRAFQTRPSVILIHDSARPLVNKETIRRVERAAQASGVALAAWPLSDTLKEERNGRVHRTIPRENLWLAQTPQGFRRDTALQCLLKPSRTATDDVELAQRRGVRVQIVEGSPQAMKVTVARDLEIVRRLGTL